MAVRFRNVATPITVAALAMAGVTGFSQGTDASTSYTYDPVGRLTTAAYDNGVCVAYAYDAAGNRAAQTNTLSGPPISAVWGSGVWGCFDWTPH